MVGDGGLEPPTSTMSTWRSTPELIALTSILHLCADYIRSTICQSSESAPSPGDPPARGDKDTQGPARAQ